MRINVESSLGFCQFKPIANFLLEQSLFLIANVFYSL